MTGSSGFLGRWLKKSLEGIGAQQLDLISLGQGLPDVYDASFTLLLSGGYSPVSNTEFSPSKALLALESIERIFKQNLSIEKVVLVSSTDANLNQRTNSTSAQALYSQHKRDIEKLVRARANSTGAQLAILRVGPLYGPGEEKYKRLIPTWIGRAIQGENFEFNGPARFSRPYLYVQDAAEVISNFTISRFRTGLFDFHGVENITAGRLEAAIKLALSQVEVKVSRFPERDVTYTINEEKIILNSHTPFETGIHLEVGSRLG